jgi:uncharacterized protein (TIGR03083 family)
MAASEFVTTDHQELAQRIDAAHRRAADLLGRVDEAMPVGDQWTARDVLAHLVCVVNRYNEFDPSRLASTPRGVDGVNRRELDDLDGCTRASLLDRLDAEMGDFHARWGPAEGLPLSTELSFHGGGTIDLQSGLANLVGEFLVHGLDVSRCAGSDWEIAPRDGALLCGLATQLLPSYVRADHRTTLSARFDLDGVEPWVLDLHGPVATSRRPAGDERFDVHLCGPATPVALVFYGRQDLAGAAEDGLVVCGGRRPELASRITEAFERP